jgi:thiamine-monophosphate kinase
MKTLADLGEFGLIERIRQHAQAGLADLKSGSYKAVFADNHTVKTQLLGIGDDCAVIPLPNTSAHEKLEIVTSDMLLEGSHFRLDWISAEELGYKSLAVNLSDIAAMGGTPTAIFLSLGLPADTSLEWVDGFLDGFLGLAKEHNVPLMGGDTTKSIHGVVISVTVTGWVPKSEILLRSEAKPGEWVAILGRVGESGAGLKWLEKHGVSDKNISAEIQHCIRTHHQPTLFMQEARWLAKSGAVGAMLDLSDGALSDASHIAEQSDVTIQIDIDKIPITNTLQSVGDQEGGGALELALTAGEDYGLLFTLEST